MATVSVEYFVPVPAPVETRIHLTLTEPEARVLMELTFHVSGDREGNRGVMDDIREELNRAGIERTYSGSGNASLA